MTVDSEQIFSLCDGSMHLDPKTIQRDNNPKRQMNDSDKSGCCEMPTANTTGPTTSEPVKTSTSMATVALTGIKGPSSGPRAQAIQMTASSPFRPSILSGLSFPGSSGLFGMRSRSGDSRSDRCAVNASRVSSPSTSRVNLPCQPPPADALILMSTPAGNDNLFNASIVLPVG